MSRRIAVIIILISVITVAASAQETVGPSLFNLSFAPALSIPMVGDNTTFDMGAAGDLRARMTLPFLPYFFVGADLSYTFSPLRRNDTLSLLSGGVELGLAWQMIPGVLTLSAYGGGGYFYGFLNSGTGNGNNPEVTGGAGLSLNLSPAFSIGLAGTYRCFFGLYNDVAVAVGTSYHFGGTVKMPTVQVRATPTRATPLQQQQQQPGEMKPGTGLQFSKVTLTDVYPVFYKYYDDHPVGSAVLHNFEKVPVKNVKVSVYVKDYMSDAKEVARPEAIDAGGDATVDLYGLFTKDILANTEATKVSARVTVSYTLNGAAMTQSQVQTLQVLKRNSLTWDDDRKVAAFVSANDPTAVKFAKNVQSMVQGKASTALEPNILLVMAIHEALTLYGLTYSSDPVATLNSDNKTVDYIQFPEQTLDYRGGKCSDFSVLYASMLEALGLETAFITIPGHIYVAVALATSPDQVRKTFTNSDDFLYQNGKAWLPIEITLRDGGFMKAWQLGAREYRDSSAKKEAAFLPLHDAWKIYQPVGYSSTVASIQIPAEDRVVKAYGNEVDAFVTSQIGQQESALMAAVNKATSKSKPLNSLAVLYSRYGLYDKATKALEQILAKDEYVPALINLGNVYFVQSQTEKALEYYDRANKKDPNNPSALLCIARANQVLENYSIAKQAFAKLQEKDPDLAAQYSFLNLRGEEATRAANASGLQNTILWQE
jgi:tetratricopeptide (TPR) repeat protein